MWDWSKNQIEIIFLRHGMTIENEQHRYLGNTDTSLSRNGICKLQALQKNGTYSKTDILFCSPMKRCTETAEILYPNHTPIYIPEWREMDFGEFEGIILNCRKIQIIRHGSTAMAPCHFREERAGKPL